MNCKQCGAPMNVEENQDFFHCEYCGSYDFPDANQDGVALLDETSPYACPTCRKPLVSAIVNTVHIFACPNCRGNLIEQSKMLPILRQAQTLDSASKEQNQRVDESERSRIAICPSCQNLMSVYPYGGPGNIMIQGCEQCQMIWLDFGELSKVARAYAQMYNHPPEEKGEKKKWVEF